MHPMQITRQANTIAAGSSVYVVYCRDDKRGFVWVWYRKTPMGSVRLGSTCQAATVIKRTEKLMHVV